MSYRGMLGMPGVARAANVTYLTMQVRRGDAATCAPWWSASSRGPAARRSRAIWWPGRQITRSHYEAVADVETGFALGERIRIRRHDYTVVGLTRRMVSSGGDPMVFIPLKDAQEAQFLKDNDAIVNERAPHRRQPGLQPPRRARPAGAVHGLAEQQPQRQRRAGADRSPAFDAEQVAEPIRRWKHLQVYTRAQMEEILVAKLIATSAKQIGMFLVILAIVSAAIVAFIIYTMTLGKIREIAVLKLIGTRNRTIAGMILQQALGLGLIGFVVGKIAATFWAPVFPEVRAAGTGRCRARLGRGDGDLRAGQHAGDPRGAARSIRRRRSVAEHDRTCGIRIEGLSKRYGEGDTAVDALKDVDMSVAPGEVVGLIGPSGSGKSTLLKCLGAVIEPTAGRMTLGSEVIYDDGWKIPDLRALRRDRIGFVFQAPYLIPFLDVTDNVALLPMLAGRPNAEARARALELLTALDVAHRAKAQPSQLSGGEQQRVSIARALANRPPVILADEPTAPLDSERALAVMRILNQMAAAVPDRDHRRHARREDHPDLQAHLPHPRRPDHEEAGEGRSL